MILEFNQVKEILNKQPISYYLGRFIKVTLSNCNSTYYSFNNDKIVISYPQIIKCLAILSKTDTSIDTKTAILIIRSLLYHEVGHAMLTSKCLCDAMEWYNNKEYYDAMNIIEDERIEWILEGYIKNVDFKKVLSVLAPPVGSNKTTLGQFFDLVRFNVYEDEWSVRVDNLLIRYCDLLYNSNSSDTWSYARAVYDLYDDYKQAHPYEEEEEEEDNNSFEDINTNENSNYDSNNNFNDNSGDFNTDNSDDISYDNLDKLSEGNPEDEVSEEIKELIRQIIEKIEISDEDTTNFDEVVDEVNQEAKQQDNQNIGRGSADSSELFKECNKSYINDKLYQELTRIFNSVNKVHKMNSAVVNAYSGILDPRSAGRNDYKYFVQRNRNGNSRAYSKVHLNLFLDRSGSFYCNEDIANEIIHTLSKIEKMNPDFDYTLVTIATTPRLENKKNIYYVADGGTDINDDVPKIFKQVQDRNAVNYNLVLFDGIATTYSTRHNWSTFNTNNTLIISDPENEDDIKAYCKNARFIITERYTEELIDNIIKILGSIVR